MEVPCVPGCALPACWLIVNPAPPSTLTSVCLPAFGATGSGGSSCGIYGLASCGCHTQSQGVCKFRSSCLSLQRSQQSAFKLGSSTVDPPQPMSKKRFKRVSNYQQAAWSLKRATHNLHAAIACQTPKYALAFALSSSSLCLSKRLFCTPVRAF